MRRNCGGGARGRCGAASCPGKLDGACRADLRPGNGGDAGGGSAVRLGGLADRPGAIRRSGRICADAVAGAEPTFPPDGKGMRRQGCASQSWRAQDIGGIASGRSAGAPVGSKAAGAEFRDTWTLNDIKVEWIGMIEDLHPALHQTPVAADRLNRQWAGVDLSEKAVELVKGRIKDDQGLFKEIVHRTDLPRRDDIGTLPPPKSHKPDLYGEQGGHCAGCGQHFELRNLEIDHIVARSSGGLDHKENLQLLCGGCNRVKGDRGMEYFLSSLKMDGIQLKATPS